MIKLDVIGKLYEVTVGDDVHLPWVIHDHLKLTGTARLRKKSSFPPFKEGAATLPFFRP